MATKAITIEGQPRTEFGKGAARRTRRAGLIPVVVYSNELEAPIHASVDRLEFTAIVRNHGVNALVNLNVEGEEQLTLIKHVDQNPLTFEIDHADLYAISRGERVEVEVPVVHAGEPAAGTLVYQDTDTIMVEADVLSIPEQIEINVEGFEYGTQILAKDVAMPANCSLVTDEEALIISIVAPETEDIEAEETEGIGEEANPEVEATEEGETASEEE